MNFVGKTLTSTDENSNTGYIGEKLIKPPVLVAVAYLQNFKENI
jgi:hypothetical protein